ncbi:hypothetical protein LV84_03620 [Algoriphagus ratkowskyi]|uniref:Uncharacterized protein n=1 Tax=Algoriphagus ratkowskyi TaxID=57028 RepID=A0A2W7SMB9_9BACT|nr:hypothetical protein [Algoriphagus ratkowskyi]PZX51862.1 hypothetical protein LV84_03620 [Algoriphagus ratkowskyi]TXD76005.1 hypothetical protein ESW18_18070 [Algoriphagus ratkowskyi]
MQAYVNFLLEDITAAHRPADYFNKSRKNSEEEDLEEALLESEMFVSQEVRSGFEGYCGLKRESFPPVDQLSNEQLAQLTSSFVKMMESWNLLVHFPDDLPQPIRYELLMEILVGPVMIFNHGYWGFDFCTGEPVGCKLGEYCPCLNRE